LKIASCILTSASFPDNLNGSWTQRLTYYLSDFNNCNVDYLICTSGNGYFKSNVKMINVNNRNNKYINYVFKINKYKKYIYEIHRLLFTYDKLNVCIVDNYNLKFALTDFLKEKSLFHRVNIIFYCCGFSYYFSNTDFSLFINGINELILLGRNSYDFHKYNYSELPCQVTILNNPINKKLFYVPTKIEKDNLKKRYGITDKIVYLWLSHDRPKKGLSIILNIWIKFASLNKNCVLLVVGAEKSLNHPQINYYGIVNSNDVVDFYKMSDIYLFPTLWQEGFGLSLAQAMCCGNYCIASDYGNIRNYFRNSIDGILISNPHLIFEWENALVKAYDDIVHGWNHSEPGSQILNINEWCEEFNKIFLKWKPTLGTK